MSEPTWELLGGGGVVGGPIDYIGTWAAGTQYQPGQVVRHNGVDYLAVNPSLGQTPPSGGAGIVPTPVNGQWLKGVGGAAVWAAITDADVSNIMRHVAGSWPTSQVKIQVGSATLACPAGDPATMNVPLASAWPSAHVAFFASVWPHVSWVFTPRGFQPNGVANGSVGISGPAQNMSVFYVSFGW